jgi:hypothetical protein
MVKFKVRSARSWFDPRYGRCLSAQLADRLVGRVGGEPALFLTLTYKREEYADPQDLYRRSQEERHVRVFIGKLARHLGVSLSGKWLCKLEFQHGGWVHWHLMLVGFKHIPHEHLENLWGHGHVWIARADEAKIRYICKYISKDGELPAWLYLEPRRSVKIIRSSPGFWGNDSPGVTGQAESPGMGKLPVYISIGEMVERADEHITVTDADGRWATVKCDPWTLFEKLRDLGAVAVPSDGGWLALLHVSMADVGRVTSELACLRASATTQESAAEGGLHLIRAGNPPLRRWVRELFEWQSSCRDEVASYAMVGGCDESVSG